MYYCFVKKFDLDDPILIVICKDGNNLNLHYKNLQLVEKSTVKVKVYREDKKKKPFKTISQYDHQGNLIKTYPSILDAAEAIGCAPN